MSAAPSATTSARPWPLRLRAMSFAITFAVVTAEVAAIALPAAMLLWLAGIASAFRAAAVAFAIALAYALAIAVYTHLSPPGIRRRALGGEL
jgi:hypothetical protein